MPVSELSHPALAFRLGLLLTLLLGTPGRALAERLPIKTYTTTDGLASDGVNRIVKDSRGFLWFCTSEGLSRFDGYKFTNYGVEQGLPDRRVNDLLETHSGVYWVATDRGLCRFNPSASSQSSRTDAAGYEPRFVIYHLGDDERSDVAVTHFQSSRAVYRLCEDREGNLWCGSESSVYRINPDHGQWVSTPVDLGPPTTFGSTNALSILADQRGAIWVLTGSGLYGGGQMESWSDIQRRRGCPLQTFHHSSKTATEICGSALVSRFIGLSPNRRLAARWSRECIQ